VKIVCSTATMRRICCAAVHIMGKILYQQENALGAFIMNCSSLAGKHVIS
jgi:hypothetical protein